MNTPRSVSYNPHVMPLLARSARPSRWLSLAAFGGAFALAAPPAFAQFIDAPGPHAAPSQRCQPGTPGCPEVSVDAPAVSADAPAVSGQAASGAAVSGAAVSGSVAAGVRVPDSVGNEIAAALIRVPLRVSAGVNLGFTTQLDGIPLDGSMAEYSGALGVAATPWLSIEARAAYIASLRRVRDADGNGRADGDPGALTAFHGSLAARFRWFHDYHTRHGWSLALGAGYWHPMENRGTHPSGITLDAAVARHIGMLSTSRYALELGLELRGRTGVGGVSDLQSLSLGLFGAWEGDQDRERDRPHVVATGGYAPGHTFGVEASGAVFLGPNTRAGTQLRWGAVGQGVALAGGIVLARPFELLARAGYLGRPSERNTDDTLHALVLEAGARLRWGVLFLEGDAGLYAPFGTFRDRVATSPFVGGAAGARVALAGEGNDGTYLTLGVRTRVGVGGEHALDALLFSAGIEWEGGRMHAPPFPRVAAAAAPAQDAGVITNPGVSAGAGANVGVGVGAGAGAGAGGGVSGGGGANTVIDDGANTNASGGVIVRERVAQPQAPAGPSYTNVPLSVAAGYEYGYIAPLRDTPLQRTVSTWSLRLSAVPTHWLSLDGRVGYLHAAARTEDFDGDGRDDRRGAGLSGVHLAAGARLRWLFDREHRAGWSLGVLGGYFLPTSGFGARSGGATVEAVLAREVGAITDSHNAFGLALELRARTGLLDLGDFQTVTLGANGYWEGNVDPRRSPEPAANAWVASHTFELDAGGYLFLGGGTRANGVRMLGDLGWGFGLSAGAVIAPVFELRGRVGYLHRSGSGDRDALSAATLELGPRFRWGFLTLQPLAGYAAVYGTQRYEVASGFYAGGVLQGRLEMTRAWHFVAGVEARFGLGAERGLDHIGLTVGFEFEGGRNYAPAFPSGPPARHEWTAPIPVTEDWRNQPTSGGDEPGGRGQVVGGGGGAGAGGRVGGGASAGAGVGGSVGAGGAVSAGAGIDLGRAPLRVALGVGAGVNNTGVRQVELDGTHGSGWLSVGWVPRRFFALELTGSYLTAGGRGTDADRNGRPDRATPGLSAFGLTAGPCFRLLTDGDFRYGWSLALAGGFAVTNEGSGPMAEAALGRHVATIGAGGGAWEVGVEARARYASIAATPMPGDRGGDVFALTLGLTGAWEGNVARNSAPAPRGYHVGETLSFELGYGFFLPVTLRTGHALETSGTLVSVATGLVFAPAFELRARAGYVGRSAGDQRDSAAMLFAEAGPRFRWGWAAVDVTGGYTGLFGIYREGAAGAPVVGAGLSARALLVGEGRHFGVTFGVTARVGVSEERVYDQLVATVGFEFEGGNQQSRPFPAWFESALRAANQVATQGARVRVDASAAVGGELVLTPGNTFDAENLGRAGDRELTTDDVTRVLPAITREVHRLTVTVYAPSGANGAAIESMVTNAVTTFYEGKARVTTRVVAGARQDRFAISVSAEP